MIISNLDHVEVMSETVTVEGAGKKYKKYGKGYKKFKLDFDVDIAIAKNVSNVTQVALFSKDVTQLALVSQAAVAEA